MCKKKDNIISIKEMKVTKADFRQDPLLDRLKLMVKDFFPFSAPKEGRNTSTDMGFIAEILVKEGRAGQI